MPKPKTMKSGSPDDFQTEPAALDYLLPYLAKVERASQWQGQMFIWEPACGKGNLVKRLRAEGYQVFASDIKRQKELYSVQDFLKNEMQHTYDCIVTNPPFSIKEKFMGRCYQLGKPWALLMPITTFDSQERRKQMDTHGIEIILPDRRIKFETPNHAARIAEGKAPGSAWFYSAWFTWGLNIGRQLTFCDEKTLAV